VKSRTGTKIGKDKKIPVARPYLWGQELGRLREALDNGWLSSQTPIVEEFEREFGRAVGARHCVAACNGTAALHLALLAAGVQPGDEVLVPDFSMIAPAFAVCYCGARPVPIDADETWNIDITQIARNVTPKTRAIIAVHTYGHPCRIEELMFIAKEHGLIVIEDAAEALGATSNGRAVGSLGDVGCHSFYANKIITTGEGGMLTTQDEDLYRRARWKSNMCFGESPETRFEHAEIGHNYRLSGLLAAVGLAQLSFLTESVAGKIAIAERYNERLCEIPGLELPPAAAWVRSVYWAYCILVDEPTFGVNRATVQRLLHRVGIETRRAFTPVHRQPFLDMKSNGGEFPVSLRLMEQGILLPSFAGLTDTEIDRIANILLDIRARRLVER
jgi:perosamine synthetase